MDSLILQVCVEKLHRVPEECGDIPWERIWTLIELARQEKKRMEQNAR